MSVRMIQNGGGWIISDSLRVNNYFVQQKDTCWGQQSIKQSMLPRKGNNQSNCQSLFPNHSRNCPLQVVFNYIYITNHQPFMCMHQFRCPWISIPTVVVVVSAVRVNLETLRQRVNFETEVDHDTMTEPTSDPDSLPKFQRTEQF